MSRLTGHYYLLFYDADPALDDDDDEDDDDVMAASASRGLGLGG